MRHRYECQLRWADMDLLGHVNNVIYVDYLQEARVDMLLTHSPDSRVGELAEGVVVVRHEVSFLVPLTFRLKPVIIESWVTDIRAASFTMAYEVFDETPEGRVVYLRAKTLLTPFVFAEERPRRLNPVEREILGGFLGDDILEETGKMTERRATDDGTYRLQARFSDVDVYGHVNNVKYFEYFQESRIDYLSRVWKQLPENAPQIATVVAQVDVDYRAPILFRTEPYAVTSWVSHVGTSSFVVESEIRDGDVLYSRARVVMVTFDPTTQKAAPAPQAYRELLEAHLTRAS